MAGAVLLVFLRHQVSSKRRALQIKPHQGSRRLLDPRHPPPSAPRLSRPPPSSPRHPRPSWASALSPGGLVGSPAPRSARLNAERAADWCWLQAGQYKHTLTGAAALSLLPCNLSRVPQKRGCCSPVLVPLERSKLRSPVRKKPCGVTGGRRELIKLLQSAVQSVIYSTVWKN